MPLKVADFLGWSPSDWKTWIAEELEKRSDVFNSDPDILIASFNRDSSLAQGYAGRELLELIQNADDAGTSYPKPNSMKIRLTKDALFVANTGVPFSPPGVKSLMLSDYSPKQLQRTHNIGYKGLGFKSVLGWSDKIAISSGKLSVGFSRENAVSWLKTLVEENPKIKEKVLDVQDQGLSNPISTLSVPFELSQGAVDSMMNEDTRSVFSALAAEGFDTVICLGFRFPGAFKRLEGQLKNITPETLLFLQHLEKLEVVTPTRVTSWRAVRRGKAVSLLVTPSKTHTWRVIKETGNIPIRLRKSEQPQLTRYEIKLAVSEEGSRIRRLHVYFPTEVAFPFPLIAHATFEVTENRQHLVETDINEWLARRLATLMARTAEGLASPHNPWRAVLSVTPDGDVDPTLVKLGFDQTLLNELRKRRVIPVRGSKFEKPADAKRIGGNFDNLLTGPIFADLCLYTDEDRVSGALDQIGVPKIEYKELRARLSKLSGTALSVPQRADIIHELLQNGLLNQSDPPEFLIDGGGATVTSESRVLLPPEKASFTLPSWVPQRFLNSELVSRLNERFGLTSVRDLATKLAVFGVQEYRLASVLSTVVAEGNKRAKRFPLEETSIRRQVIKVVWDLYSTQGTEELPKIADSLSVILSTKGGKFERANSIYMGSEYPGGNLLESLYGELGGPFVAGPKELGIIGKAEDIARFLTWLGVASLPRETVAEFTSGDFLAFVLGSLKYPAEFGWDTVVRDLGSARRCWSHLTSVGAIDRLDQILEHADPHAVACWIVKSQARLNEWRTNKDQGARLAVVPPGKSAERWLMNQVIPSYVLWTLGNSKWMPVASGEKLKPTRCTLATGVSKEVANLVGLPAFDMGHPLFKDYNVDRTSLRSSLTSIGVVQDLDELPWESFYEILSELPARDPEGKSAKSVYRALVSRSDSNPMGEEYANFIGKGAMWGRKEEKGAYMPVQLLFYLEDQTMPDSALRHFPLLDLDRRRGSTKVKKLFGVKALTASEFKVKIEEIETHPYSSELNDEVDELKPYVYSIRIEEDSDRSELGPLRKLEVKLCKKAKGSIEVETTKQEIELRDGDSIILGSDAYLVAEPQDPSKPLASDESIAFALGEIFSAIMKVDVRDQVAVLATCSPDRRDMVLDRITGGAGNARMTRAQEYFLREPGEEEEDLVAVYTPPPSPPVNPAPPQQAPTAVATPAAMAVIEPTRPSTEVGPVAVSAGQGIPIQPSRKVPLRVRVNVAQGGQTGPKRTADPDRSENVAVAFEEANHRFPMKVSHLQGFEAWGCDILSFKTDSDTRSFKKHPASKLVLRFIEVKGRSNPVGSIPLKGNELRSAHRFKDRFFIYRVFEQDDPGKFQLVELRDPVHVEADSVERMLDINPFKSKKSVIYNIVEHEAEESLEPEKRLVLKSD